MTLHPSSRSGGLARLAAFALLAHLCVFAGYVGLSHLFGSFPHAICQWDCNWYGSIIEKGYSRHADADGYANWAFFPLFPIFGLTVSYVSHLNFIMSLEVVNFICFFLLMLAGAFYARRRLGESDPYFIVCLFVTFPFGLYYRVPYSEAVYGLLVILTLICFTGERFVLAGLCAALLCASRPTGIFLVAAIGLCYLGRMVLALSDRQGRDVRRAGRHLLQGCIFVAIGCLGMLAYMIYLQIHVGDYLAFSHVERAWNRVFGNPATRLLSGLGTPDMQMRNFLTAHANSGRYLALAGVAGLVVIVIALVRRCFAEAIFLLLTLLAATSTSLEALPRIMLCNPVSIVLIGGVLSKAPAAVRWGMLSVFLMFQVLLILSWYHGWAFLT